MKLLSGLWKRLWKDESGQAVTEYGLILGILALGVCGALYYMKDPLTALYQNLSQELSNLVQI